MLFRSVQRLFYARCEFGANPDLDAGVSFDGPPAQSAMFSLKIQQRPLRSISSPSFSTNGPLFDGGLAVEMAFRRLFQFPRACLDALREP